MSLEEKVLLLTPRLTLRELVIHDLDAVTLLHKDNETKRFAWVDGLDNKKQNVFWIKEQQLLYNNGFGIHSVELLESGEFVGLAGMRIRKDLNGLVDLVYRIMPKYRKQGYATECAQYIVEMALNHMKLDALFAQIHEQNIASIKIIRGLGFEKESQDGVWNLYQKKLSRI